MRIGIGNDIHRLVAGRPLVLGGIRIESELGAYGHSDADALSHAITDAIFGALALGDIGTHFPNSDERWRNSESFVFLRYAVGLMKEHGYQIGNVDTVIELERPKLRPYIDHMRDSLAVVLEAETNRISIKAKTAEGLDAVGRGEAVSVSAVVLLTKLGQAD